MSKCIQDYIEKNTNNNTQVYELCKKEKFRSDEMKEKEEKVFPKVRLDWAR